MQEQKELDCFAVVEGEKRREEDFLDTCILIPSFSLCPSRRKFSMVDIIAVFSCFGLSLLSRRVRILLFVVRK